MGWDYHSNYADPIDGKLIKPQSQPPPRNGEGGVMMMSLPSLSGEGGRGESDLVSDSSILSLTPPAK